MIVDWTGNAISDLDRIHATISADSQYYADTVIDRLTGRCRQIQAFPYSGQMVAEYQREGIREVIEYSYRLIYLVSDQKTWILTVCHAANPLPDSPPTPHE